MRSTLKQALGGALVVPGLVWYLLILPFAVVALAGGRESTLGEMAGDVLAMLVVGAPGLVLAAAGYALLRARRPWWPLATALGSAALGVGWSLCMGTAALAGGRPAGGLGLASLGLVPVAWAASDWVRALRRAGPASSSPRQPARQPRAAQPGTGWRRMALPLALWGLFALVLLPLAAPVADGAVDYASGRPDVVAQVRLFHPPLRDPELLTVHDDGRWTRRGLRSAVPVGDVVIGELDDGTGRPAGVVALRAPDGAELWRWEASTRALISGLVVDPVDRAVLATMHVASFGWVVVGWDLDGNVTFTRELPTGPDGTGAWWSAVRSAGLDSEPPRAAGRVAVLEGPVPPDADDPSRDRHVVGVQVATGQVLWRQEVPSRCDVRTATLPQPSTQRAPVPSTSVVLAVGSCEAASLSRYDGASQRWETRFPRPAPSGPAPGGERRISPLSTPTASCCWPNGQSPRMTTGCWRSTAKGGTP